MKIGLFIPSFFKYDAMGNDVYNMYLILTSLGYDTYIFANDFYENGDIKIFHVSKSDEILNDSKNLIIYHHGVYTDFFDKIVNAKAKKVFRYHNITYPYLFEGYDDNAVQICKNGRKQMYNKVKKFDYFLSCSNFNNNELVEKFEVPKERTFILPPFHNIEHWKNINSEKVNFFNKKSINILNVGRFSPNKNHQLLIKSFADYNKFYNKNSYLHLVGKIGPHKYYLEIIELIKKLDIEKNVFLYTKGVEDKKLKYLYENSDLLAISSLHEGFCVPVVEAMFFSLPVVSSSCTALKETVDKYGILIEELNYIDFSVAMKYAIKYSENLSLLSTTGYSRFSYENIKNDFINFLEKILKS